MEPYLVNVDQIVVMYPSYCVDDNGQQIACTVIETTSAGDNTLFVSQTLTQIEEALNQLP
jgi:hypothetical protein